MKTERMEFTGSGIRLPGYLWTPERAAKAVILVLHGMTEHAGRYDSFARAMTEQGFAVAAYDLRGHGSHASDPNCAAMVPGDWQKSIDDIALVMEQLDALLGGLPLYLMGFSLGSFLAREYMNRDSIRADGMILIGTGWQSRWLLGAMCAVVKTQMKKVGYQNTSPLVRQLSFGAYNRQFKPNHTSFDWLCSDEAELQGYLADRLCRRDIAAGTFYELLGSMERTGRKLLRRQSNGQMPVLLISGDRDPVGALGKGVAKVRELMECAGYPVSFRLFPGGRHVLLREVAGGQAEQVCRYISGWLDAHI